MNGIITFKTLEIKKKLCQNKLFIDKLLEFDNDDLRYNLNNYSNTGTTFYIKMGDIAELELLEICESLNLSYCYVYTNAYNKDAKLISTDRKIIMEKGEMIHGTLPDYVLENIGMENYNHCGEAINNYLLKLSVGHDVFIESL